MTAAEVDNSLVALRLRGEITTEEYYEQIGPHLDELRQQAHRTWPAEVLGPAFLKAIEDCRGKREELVRDTWLAMMLAPNLEICVALLNGEDVPVEKLDQEWVRRFGLKR